MQLAIKRIDTSLIPPETCQCFFIFLQDTLTRLYKKTPASPVFTILLDDRTALKCRAGINQMNQIN